MKEALIITTVSGFVPQFEMNNVRILQKLGYRVHYASNFHTPVYGKDNKRLDNTGIVCHQIDFVRSPYNLRANIKCYKMLEELIKNNDFDLIHCHTPMGGVLGRLAAKKFKNISIIYTAHGFHFYNKAPIINWLLYYPIEKILANYTDVLITINKEDYERASKFKVRKKVEYIKGVGINPNINKIEGNNKKNFMDELGIKKDAFILTSVGELTKRKNHEVIIKAIALLQDINVVYIICGSGKLEKYLKKLVDQLNIGNQVIFNGYTEDIHTILENTDCFVFPSLQEGLPVALLEAMIHGLPVICSNIRGNLDLIQDKCGGYIVKSNTPNDYANAIQTIKSNKSLLNQYGLHNKKVVKNFSLEMVSNEMLSIYSSITHKK